MIKFSKEFALEIQYPNVLQAKGDKIFFPISNKIKVSLEATKFDIILISSSFNSLLLNLIDVIFRFKFKFKIDVFNKEGI